MPRKKVKPPEMEETSSETTAENNSSPRPNPDLETSEIGDNNLHQSLGNEELVSTDYVTFKISKRAVWILSVFFGVLAIFVGCYGAYLQTFPHFHVPPEIYEDLGVDGIVLFRQYDRDDDGVLDIEEFEPLGHRLLEMNNGSKNMIHEYDSDINVTDEVLTVHSFFQPLVLETMTKDMEVPSNGLNSLTGLKAWKIANKDWDNFSARQLINLFLPDKSFVDTFNYAYKITEFIGSPVEERGPPLSSNRYYPARVSGNDVTIHRLLAMFHPVPHVHMRFAPQGAAACIRAFNQEYLDIMFRIHSEFQLNEPPFYPFWFTPAQFMGRLVITRNLSHVVHFHMKVPTDKKLNVDMEWMNGPRTTEENEVDIGFMPQMELRGVTSSHPAVMDSVDVREAELTEYTNPDDPNVDNIQWTGQVTMYEASRTLEKYFYKFKEVEYYNITQAVKEAKRLNRPLHHIALWGALDDQSC